MGRNGRQALSEEKHSILRTRTWELFGFGCYYAWFLSIIFGGNFFSEDMSEEWVSLVRLGFSFGLAVGYLVLFIFRHREIVVHLTKNRILAAGFMASVGTAIVSIPLMGPAGYLIVGIASCMVGLGNAILMTAGGEFWASNRSERAMMQLSTSIVAALVTFYALGLLPIVLRTPVVCLFPLACALILVKSRGGKARSISNLSKEFFGSNLEIRFSCSVFVIAVSCGLILGRATFLVPSEIASVTSVFLIASLSTGVVALYIAVRVMPNRFLIILSRFSSVCLVVGCFLALALSETSFSLIGIAFVMAGYLLFDEFMWLLHSELIYRSQAPAAEVLPRFEMTQCLGLSIGLLASQAARFPIGGFVVEDLHLYAACGIVLALIVVLVFSSTDIVRIVEVRSRTGTLFSLEQQCEDIADRFGLSNREREVLALLARGRSTPYIQDELCIAQGTVKSHVRHIYTKLDITSKQELINLVETSGADQLP